MRKQLGFTVLELLLVLTVLGILFALAGPALRSDHFAVRQAAQGLSAQVVRARLEALRLNTGVGIFVDQTAQRYFLFVDRDGNYTYNTNDEAIVGTTVHFGEGNARLVRLNSNATLVFDPRGFLRDASTTSITLTDRTRQYAREVRVSAQGRSSVQ